MISSIEAKAAGGDHRDVATASRQLEAGLQVKPFQHAVALDVGVDDRGDAGVLEPPREVERASARDVSRPALDRDLAVAGVDADGDAARETASPPRCTSAGSRTAAVPMMTRATPLSSQRSIVSRSRMPPPSCTGMPDRREDRLDRRRIDRPAGEGAVQIDDVQLLEACAAKVVRLRGRVIVEDGGARHVALLRRTHTPSLRSMAGNRITAAHRRLRLCAAKRQEIGPSWLPSQEIRDSRDPSRWLFSG